MIKLNILQFVRHSLCETHMLSISFTTSLSNAILRHHPPNKSLPFEEPDVKMNMGMALLSVAVVPGPMHQTHSKVGTGTSLGLDWGCETESTRKRMARYLACLKGTYCSQTLALYTALINPEVGLFSHCICLRIRDTLRLTSTLQGAIEASIAVIYPNRSYHSHSLSVFSCDCTYSIYANISVLRKAQGTRRFLFLNSQLVERVNLKAHGEYRFASH